MQPKSFDREPSQWRIELARELAKVYAQGDAVEMIVLGGSPSRGLSDAYSDLDLVLYWKSIDHKYINRIPPLASHGCERLQGRESSGNSHLETYYMGPLKVDLAHMTITAWTQMADSLQAEWEPLPESISSIGGFLDSTPIHGVGEIEAWKQRLAPYPDQLCTNFARANMNCFVPGYLLRQCYGRGEVLALLDGISLSIKRLLNLLAAANRQWFVADEGRWVAYYLGRMQYKPDHCWERIQSMLSSPAPKAIHELEQLTAAVHSIVDDHVPDVDTTRLRERRKSMEVLAAPHLPTA